MFGTFGQTFGGFRGDWDGETSDRDSANPNAVILNLIALSTVEWDSGSPSDAFAEAQLRNGIAA
ncbi:MAG: hypothetical protein IH960_10905 [Chloroflexi bacterium]|nr:hypothetical protein [Chloroflexota bacterium]